MALAELDATQQRPEQPLLFMVQVKEMQRVSEIIALPNSPAHHFLSELFPDRFKVTEGATLEVRTQEEPGFHLKKTTTGLSISAHERSDYFKALGTAISFPEKTEVMNSPDFEFRGIMLDASRGGVPNVPFLKEFIARSALLGINHFALYTEDTFEVDGHPEIGQGRGRYSKEEIAALVAFAEEFGITMFPAIQTLGHAEQILKHERYADLRDTHTVFSTQNEKTYQLLEELIRNASEPYSSSYIHIGMDETWELGTGNDKEKLADIDVNDVYVEHQKKVVAICQKMGLEPIVYGDMFIGMKDGTTPLTDEQFANLPEGITVNFWNYYFCDKDWYKEKITAFQEKGIDPIISPSVHDWNRFWGSYPVTEATMTPFLEAGRETGVKRAMLTFWGDDGREAPIASSYSGIVSYALQTYGDEQSPEALQQTIKTLFYDDWEYFTDPSRMDSFDQKSSSEDVSLTKGLLFDDPLTRRIASHAGEKRFRDHYMKCYEAATVARENASETNAPYFTYIQSLFTCLIDKADLGNDAHSAYHAGDYHTLQQLREKATILQSKIAELSDYHKIVWEKEHKPVGFEIIAKRYIETIAKLTRFEERLQDFLGGKIELIPEFGEHPPKLFRTFPHIFPDYAMIAAD